MFKKVWLSLMLMGAVVIAAAQTTRVRGTVRDFDTGEPLPFLAEGAACILPLEV